MEKSNCLLIFFFTRQSKESIKIIKETSKKCLTGLPKQVLNLVMFGINKGIRKNCKDDETKTIAYQNLACLNRVTSNMTLAMSKVTRDFRFVNFIPGDDKLKGICCSFYKFQSKLSKLSNNKCPSKSTAHMEDLMNEFSGEALSLVCNSIPRESDICQNFILPYKEYETELDSTLKSITFVPSILNALTNL